MTNVNTGALRAIRLMTGALTVAALLVGCSSLLDLSSRWRNREIVIDGNGADWQGATTYVRSAGAAVGIANDADNLFVCLQTSDRATQFQIVRSGLTVWFDRTGGTNKVFGIRFPVGGRDVMQMSGDAALEGFQEAIRRSQGELELLGPGEDDRRRYTMLEGKGVVARVGFNEETLVYELKIPLWASSTHPFAVGVDSTNTFSIGFETATGSRERFSGVSRDVGTSMGSRSGRGRSGPDQGPSRGEGSGGDRRPAPLKVWGVVRLALPQ